LDIGESGGEKTNIHHIFKYSMKRVSRLKIRNLVRAVIVSNARDYTWSSIDEYYSNSSHDIVDADFFNVSMNYLNQKNN
jgi:hypothetical protein